MLDRELNRAGGEFVVAEFVLEHLDGSTRWEEAQVALERVEAAEVLALVLEPWHAVTDAFNGIVDGVVDELPNPLQLLSLVRVKVGHVVVDYCVHDR